MTSTVANISDTSVPEIQISGGSAVFKARIKGEIIVRLYVDDRNLFEGPSRRNDLTVRWQLNPPIILKRGSRLTIKLTEHNPYQSRRRVRAEASASFNDIRRPILSCPREFKELTLSDDTNATISVLAKSPRMHQVILYDAVKVSEQTKAVLDHLGSAKRFLQTIMDLGAKASELNSIAKAVFSCVTRVYEKLKNQEQRNQLILNLAKDMAYTLGCIEDVKQFSCYDPSPLYGYPHFFSISSSVGRLSKSATRSRNPSDDPLRAPLICYLSFRLGLTIPRTTL